jgi:hypothetical protein
MQVIALHGKIGVGKDYVSRIILNKIPHPTYVIAFADHLKDLLQHKYSYEHLYNKKTEQSRKDLIDTAATLRETDPEIFIKAVAKKIQLAKDRGYKTTIITDLRLKNEYDYLKSINAAIIHISAPDRSKDKVEYKEVTTDITETSLDNINWEPNQVVDNNFVPDHTLDCRIDFLLNYHLKIQIQPKNINLELTTQIANAFKSTEASINEKDIYDVMDDLAPTIESIQDKLHLQMDTQKDDFTYIYRFNKSSIPFTWSFMKNVICIVELNMLEYHQLEAINNIIAIDENKHIFIKSYVILTEVINTLHAVL